MSTATSTTESSRRAERAFDSGSVLRIRGANGAVLAPKSGVLWVSDPSSANDVMVLPGDTYRITASGPVTVVAHGAARFALRLPSEAAAGSSVELALADDAPAAQPRVALSPGLAAGTWAAAIGPSRAAPARPLSGAGTP
jgi:hypothetical protein